IVAASDSSGGVHNPKGLDPRALLKFEEEHGSVTGFPSASRITNEDLLEVPCDILVPSALEAQITGSNAGKIKARLVVEGANGPITPDADEVLEGRKVLVVPDIDRKSTRLNSSHVSISYAVFCLKKKK